MNITRDVINDLLPAYLSGECSADTKAIIDEFAKNNPDFANEIKRMSFPMLKNKLQNGLTSSDEMKALKRTKKLIKLRTTFMAFAIFFSLSPFSFLHFSGKTYWLFIESPTSALLYGAIGIVFWFSYFYVRSKTQSL